MTNVFQHKNLRLNQHDISYNTYNRNWGSEYHPGRISKNRPS